MPAVLRIDAHREDLEPDPLEIDASDVVPCDDGDELVLILDETNRPALEAGARDVVEPLHSRRADPSLDIDLEWRPGGAGKAGEPSRVTERSVELAQDHRVEAAASASRSRSAAERICGPPGTRSFVSASGSNAGRTHMVVAVPASSSMSTETSAPRQSVDELVGVGIESAVPSVVTTEADPAAKLVTRPVNVRTPAR